MRTALIKLAMPHAGSELPRPIVTASLGVAADITTSGTTSEDLVRAADQALYTAKKREHNNVNTELVKATNVPGDR